jgi:hypothetical protein
MSKDITLRKFKELCMGPRNGSVICIIIYNIPSNCTQNYDQKLFSEFLVTSINNVITPRISQWISCLLFKGFL